MKKLTLVIAIFTAMLFAACGNKTNADNSGQDSDTVVKSFEQQQIEASVKMQLDSIAAEISSKKFTPLYQAINNEFCKRLPEETVYVNREEDMGMENLRRTKLSYKPYMMGAKYSTFVK